MEPVIQTLEEQIKGLEEENRQLRYNLCKKCGEKQVCPKCTPVIQHTNAVIIRCKDTSYNSGYPNAFIISPLYNRGDDPISVATIVGDNFWKKQHTYYGHATVEQLAFAIHTWSVSCWFENLDIPKTAQMKRAVEDLRGGLKEFVESLKQEETKQEEVHEYWYEFRYRGLSPGAQPKDFVGSNPDHGRFGAVAYNRPLTQKEIDEYELTLITK